MNLTTTSTLAVAACDTLVTYPSSSKITVLVILVVMIGIFQILMGVFCLG